MDKVKCTVKNMSGGDAGTVELSPNVFAAPAYKHLVHQVVRWQLAKRRAGTHDVLTRSEIKGGKKKPFKQKGTGRARAGSSVSPLMVGGAVVHGPTPRSYEFKIPKESRRKALCAALSSKLQAQQLVVLDKIDVKQGKTSEVTKLLKSLGIEGNTTLIVTNQSKDDAQNLTQRAARNIAKVKTLAVAGVNVYDILKYKYLVVSQDALSGIEARCQKKALKETA